MRLEGEFPGGPVVRTPLSLPRALVQSLVRELRSHKPSGARGQPSQRLGASSCRKLGVLESFEQLNHMTTFGFLERFDGSRLKAGLAMRGYCLAIGHSSLHTDSMRKESEYNRVYSCC